MKKFKIVKGWETVWDVVYKTVVILVPHPIIPNSLNGRKGFKPVYNQKQKVKP